MYKIVEESVYKWKKAEVENLQELERLLGCQRMDTAEWQAKIHAVKQESVHLQIDKKQLEFYLAFWQVINHTFPHRYILPALKVENWHCDGMLFMKDSIHIFHLLPINIRDLKIEGRQLCAICNGQRTEIDHSVEELQFTFTDYSTEEIVGHIGESQLYLDNIQQRWGCSKLPVHEYYLVPHTLSHFQYEEENTIVASLGHLLGSFQNLASRVENESPQDPCFRLFEYLQNYIQPYVPSYAGRLTLPNEHSMSEDQADKGYTAITSSRSNEKVHFLQSIWRWIFR